MIKKSLLGIKHSISGFKLAYRYDESFRKEVIFFIPLILFIIFKEIYLIKKLILFGTLVIILVVELLNTAIEKTIDTFSKNEYHPLLKVAKDAASCAVFFVIILSILIWIYVLNF